MAIIAQEDSKYTFELTGQDLKDYIEKRAKPIQPTKKIQEPEEETKYTMADTEEVFNSYDDALEYIYAEEIIYYNKAMEYLSEHDWSLRESLSLAHDFGFQIENLTSETLATIHYQDFLINSLEEFKTP
tara:strand:+ start:358 stop:744 length:387 start_codon:yes stop_codon:yes gene_type:complete